MSITYAVTSGVALLTLDRPEVLNALDLETGRRYNGLLHRADSDPDVRAIVVTGAGRAFCSGADLSSMGDTDGVPAEERLPADGLQPELAMLVRKPVVAAVNGPAIGVGLVLALYADVRIAAEDAVLSLGFPRLGLVAEYGTAWLLPRLVGASRATELLLSGRRLRGSEAADIGLVLEARPASEVLPAAVAYARELAEQCSPSARAAAKRQLADGYGDGLRAALDDSRRRMLAALDGPELREGFSAQAERRPPRFAPLADEADA
jgi:enoyl-CoA hydratase/carnithine racemase